MQQLIPVAASQTIFFLFRGDRVPLVMAKGVLHRERFLSESLPRSEDVPSPGIKIRRSLCAFSVHPSSSRPN
ncbi:hypothetical protein EUGRSUZ_H02265 [Eucalyptus grandis]|uniref:Uncharacterized protein n=2 Tax=Eucalyptus grandis TaxID=71139 RepID=A0ACC3JQH4_EUCGR|nr:hypothetical protein EUGRSUZ_H02265 [Eucalyptus grandis]